MKPNEAWITILEARKQLTSWRHTAEECYGDMIKSKSIFRLEKGRMSPTLVIIVQVSSFERVRIRRLDNGKEYYVSTYYINPNASGGGRGHNG